MERIAEKIGFLIKLTRATEWWEYKLPLMLAIGYATALLSGVALSQVALQILFYLVAIMVSYTYVSLINDFTDIEEDSAVGKRTGMLGLSPAMRLPVLIVSIGIGVVFGLLMWPDILSLIFFASTWVVFTLYSVRPFRWKARGLLGVLCDASGVHLFPSLLMVTGISNASGIAIHYGWLATVGIWAFAYGLRGILWHQFMDKPNDLQTQTNTLASKLDAVEFRPIAAFIVLVELSAFAVMLVYISQPLLLVLFPLYFLLVGVRMKKYGRLPIFIVAPHDKPWQMIMLDFYQFFFPIGLLVLAAITQKWAWVVLVIHIALFPGTGLHAIRDYIMAFKLAGRKLIKSMQNLA